MKIRIRKYRRKIYILIYIHTIILQDQSQIQKTLKAIQCTSDIVATFIVAIWL